VDEITRNVKNGSDEMLDGATEVIQESNNLEKATREITGGMTKTPGVSAKVLSSP
jgi:methyl-accepting chemotaxis protein